VLDMQTFIQVRNLIEENWDLVHYPDSKWVVHVEDQINVTDSTCDIGDQIVREVKPTQAAKLNLWSLKFNIAMLMSNSTLGYAWYATISFNAFI
jgi:hypothetical protein